MDIEFVDGELSEAFEYFCIKCLQCRLSFVKVFKCSHCGGQIITGPPFSLDLDELRRKYSNDNTQRV